ncbi:hypothetical protein [Escherichia coli]|uniref:hypothetical protein n=1 Tax=Escherichia coli TaxID=562 RepID=UPI00200FDB29|nr:hypothetical protein [Escherichia coli]
MKNKRKNLDAVGVFLIWAVAALLISLFMLVTEAHASRTMHLVDQYHDENALICVYSDGRHYAEVERPRGSQNCPYTHIEY